MANSSGGYTGNNSSTAINAQNASGDTGSKATASNDSSGNFANSQSTTVHALSTSLTAQTTATSAINSASIGAAPSLLQLANDIAPALSNSLSPTNISQQINAESIAGHTAVLNTPPQFKGILATLPNLALPQIALYQINSSPTATYIVETDPKFLNPASAGSLANATTLLQDLQTTSNITQKLIGDAFYQQQLVNQQIGALTGKAFISGYNTTNSEYAALLTNGATFASQYGLTLGIGLTATQMAQLTSDIVWLVSEPITLPDGRVENALVPQVYLIPRAGDVNGNGTLISANQIQLTATGDVTNSGTIAGERVVVINANNISDTGDISGTQVGLNALNDLKIIGGTVHANEKLVLSAGRDVDVTTTTQSTSNTVGASSYIQTSIDRIAGLYLGNSAHPSAKGLLSISAGHDIHLTAADISNQSIDGTTQLDAGNSVNLDTVTTAVQNNMIQNAKNYVKMGNSQDVGTQISTQGNLLVHADNQINATAATLNSANGTLQLTAKDISINSGTATDSFANANVTKKNGFLSHATITAADSLSNTHAIGSSLGGKDVVISANHDLIVTGSQIIGDNSATLAAQHNLIIQNAINTNSSSQLHDEKKSGLLSAGSSTIGFTIGKKQQTDTSTTSSRSAAASTIGSVNGDVNIIAGNQYTQTGSDIQTPNGDTNIIAKNITIQNAQDVSNNTQDQKTMQSGLTLAITNPIASAAQSIKQMADAAGKTDSNRMKTLAGASAALTAYNTKNSLKDDPMGKDGKRIGPNGTEGQTATQKAEDIRVSLTYGASQSHSHSEQDGTTASSSHITAGGDVNLIATGDKNNDQGDINIIGSDINAGHNVSLDAANTISILAAQDTNTNTSRNTSSSGAIGVAASAKDHSLGVTASASYGQGNTDGHDVTQVNSHITAGSGSTAGTASLTSGGDTIIKGGVITANTIDADVGGNLTIESLQDTSTYKSHQIDASGSVTVGYGVGASGSLSMSQVTSDYASVTEQSGLKAGDGGFNVKVKGSTDLKGGAISSTQTAIDEGKNSFSSTTLTTSDIDNHASYDANSVSVSAGTGGSLGGSAGVGHDSGNASSVTQSGISGIAGNTAARTGDASTGINKIFDVTKVQSEINAQTQITAAFSQQAPKAIATYSGNKAAELRAQGNEAEAKKWDEGGVYRTALHTVSGGLSGGVAGALGAGTVAYEAKNLTQMQTDLTNNLANSMITPDMTDQEKQAAYNKANMIAQGVMELTAAGVGAVASGGSVQGAGSALAVDANNRQLSKPQIAAVKGNAKSIADFLGLTQEQEAQLGQAQLAEICALQNCDAGQYGTPNYDELVALKQQGDALVKANNLTIDDLNTLKLSNGSNVIAPYGIVDNAKDQLGYGSDALNKANLAHGIKQRVDAVNEVYQGSQVFTSTPDPAQTENILSDTLNLTANTLFNGVKSVGNDLSTIVNIPPIVLAGLTGNASQSVETYNVALLSLGAGGAEFEPLQPLTGEAKVGTTGADQTVSLFGFRGAGSTSDLLAADAPHPYVVTGHVGYSFDGGQTIYGFGPNVTEGMSAYDAVQSLKKGDLYPGIISDDTAVFESVLNNPAIGRDGISQTVIQQQIPVAQSQFDAMLTAHNSIGVGNHMDNVLYGFPPKGSTTSLDCLYNCATFPSSLGIPIPEGTGNMKIYMPQLEQLGTPWKPAK